MKYLTNFKTEFRLRRLGIKNYEIVNGVVNVYGDVTIPGKSLEKIPFKFGEVTGTFDCSNNKITSLEGSPNSVGGDFYCDRNELTTLQGGPKYTGGSYLCDNNKLISLEGTPSEINNSFSCGKNKLTSLKGGPKSIKDKFICGHNEITSLEYAPNHVGGDFYCNNNKIRDFKIPEFSLNENKNFYCLHNPIYKIYSLFDTPKCIDLINEYSAVQGYNVIWDRLSEVYYALNMKIPNPKKVYIKGFKLVFNI